MHSTHHHHAHPTTHDDREPVSEHEWLCRAMRELLIERGIVSRERLRATMEWKENLAAHGHENGARIVARAWSDEGFRERLLADGGRTVAELGLELKEAQLVVCANGPEQHHLIVCTLCSCYPRSILGEPPMWYTTASYRQRAVREPRSVLSEFGVQLPEQTAIQVHDSTADMRYLVLPQRPEGTADWNEEDLARLVGRDALLGTALPRAEVTVW